jgi:ribosomal protein L31
MTKRPINEVMALEILVALFVLIAICLSSCKCPQIAESTVTRDSIVYKDSVVTIHDTDVFNTFAYVDSILHLLKSTHDTTIIKTTKRGVTTSLRVANGKLICEATIDSLQAKIDSIKSHVTYVEKTRNVLSERQISKFEQWQRRLFWVFGIIIALFVAYKLKK